MSRKSHVIVAAAALAIFSIICAQSTGGVAPFGVRVLAEEAEKKEEEEEEKVGP